MGSRNGSYKRLVNAEMKIMKKVEIVKTKLRTGMFLATGFFDGDYNLVLCGFDKFGARWY